VADHHVGGGAVGRRAAASLPATAAA
jgi:hypothetical protein